MLAEHARIYVQDGAAFLDDRADVPHNWRNLIRIEDLDMMDQLRSVLGQLGPHIISVDPPVSSIRIEQHWRLGVSDAEEFGFAYICDAGTPLDEETRSFETLTQAWKDLLSKPTLLDD